MINVSEYINNLNSEVFHEYSKIVISDGEAMIDNYEELLAKAIYLKFYEKKSVESIIKCVEACLNWLRTTDFYTAPASTQYHESHPSGLLKHSLNVYNCIIDLLTCSKFSTVDKNSAVLVALVHDWCKISLYEMFMRNVKNDQGQWEQVPSYKHNQTGIPLGHGVSSMFLISRFIVLSSDEALAIRWHMGAWRVCDSEMNELQLANETCPLVHLLQFADQLSIVNY